MGTYDTAGGSPASPPVEDETCDFCERDASDCDCSPEVLNNLRTERAFILAMKGVPPAAVVRAVNSLGIGVDFTHCGKKSMAQHWADQSHHGWAGRARTATGFKNDLGYIRRKALKMLTPLERSRIAARKAKAKR